MLLGHDPATEPVSRFKQMIIHPGGLQHVGKRQTRQSTPDDQRLHRSPSTANTPALIMSDLALWHGPDVQS